MGLIRHSVRPCPACGAGFFVDAGILADDHQYRCENCGAMLYIELRFGKIKNIRYTSPVSENKGYGGINTSKPPERKIKTNRYAWWKEHHGDNWRQAHDDFMKKHDAWLAQHVGNV